MYVTQDFYLDYIKNSHKSTIKRGTTQEKQAKDLKRHFKKVDRPISIWKGVQHHQQPGKYKLNLLGTPKNSKNKKRLTTPNASEQLKQPERSYTAGGSIK